MTQAWANWGSFFNQINFFNNFILTSNHFDYGQLSFTSRLKIELFDSIEKSFNLGSTIIFIWI